MTRTGCALWHRASPRRRAPPPAKIFLPARVALTSLTSLTSLAALAALACGDAGASRGAAARERSAASARVAPPETLLVYTAASIARPVRAALERFAALEPGVRVVQENGASLELVRRMTDLRQVPDVLVLADDEIFPALLAPRFATWYASFARNRIVLAYTARSRYAAEVGPATWREVITRPGVEVGRASPETDPSGYRTLLVFQLAERYYGEPGLAARLLAAAPERNVRPREADQVGLLQAGALDYIWTYESLARQAGLLMVRLPREVDLGSPEEVARYAAVSTRVPGRTRRDTLVVRGRPILYGLGIPSAAPHPGVASRFVVFLIAGAGRDILRANGLDALARPRLTGTGIPRAIEQAVPAATAPVSPP